MLFRIFRNSDPPEVTRISSATRISKRLARRILFHFDAQRYAELARLLVSQSGKRLFHDPMEDLPDFAEIVRNASRDADIELAEIATRKQKNA